MRTLDVENTRKYLRNQHYFKTVFRSANLGGITELKQHKEN